MPIRPRSYGALRGLSLVGDALSGKTLGDFAYALLESLKHAVQSAYKHASLVTHVGRP